eukprot:g2973.t1
MRSKKEGNPPNGRFGEIHSYREEYLELALDEMKNQVDEAVRNGQQKETAHFAEWEAYGRGVASKLMAKMGYIHGKGLGKEKQGMTEAIVSKTIPGTKKAGLGTEEASKIGSKKKTKRGGRLKTAKKRMRLAKEALKSEEHQKELETDSQGVFAVLNRVIGDHSEAAKMRKAELKEEAHSSTDSKKREQVASQLGKIADCKKKVAHLEKALKRNQNNKGMAEALRPKLQTARNEFLKAKQHHSRLCNELQKTVSSTQFHKF